MNLLKEHLLGLAARKIDSLQEKSIKKNGPLKNESFNNENDKIEKLKDKKKVFAKEKKPIKQKIQELKDDIPSFKDDDETDIINNNFLNNLKCVNEYKNRSIKEKLSLKNVFSYSEPINTNIKFKYRANVEIINDSIFLKLYYGYNILDENGKILFTFKRKAEDKALNINELFIYDSEKNIVGNCLKQNVEPEKYFDRYNLHVYGSFENKREQYNLEQPTYNTKGDYPLPNNLLVIRGNKDIYHILYNVKISKNITWFPAIIYKNGKEYIGLESIKKKTLEHDAPIINFNDDINFDEAMIVLCMIFMQLNIQ